MPEAHDAVFNKQNVRESYYRALGPHNLAPLWERLSRLVTKTPESAAQPALWRYDAQIREALFEAGELITAEEAERRVLILENPALVGVSAITSSLYCGVQLILPGETAPPHRHTQSALRFVLEGEGAFTTVEGVKVKMSPGDLVLTPAWAWHEHGNETSTPMVWVDGLDIPMVRFFETSFAQAGEAVTDELRGCEFMGAEMSPRFVTPARGRRRYINPEIFYPYSDIKDTLRLLGANTSADPCYGYKLQYANPATGAHVTPTIAAFMQMLPARFEGAPVQSTESSVFIVVEGEGVTWIDDAEYKWAPRDIFVAPSWSKVRHFAHSEAFLFNYSDRAAQESLGLWNEYSSDLKDDPRGN